MINESQNHAQTVAEHKINCAIAAAATLKASCLPIFSCHFCACVFQPGEVLMRRRIVFPSQATIFIILELPAGKVDKQSTAFANRFMGWRTAFVSQLAESKELTATLHAVRIVRFSNQNR
jgi:hypothetical protein